MKLLKKASTRTIIFGVILLGIIIASAISFFPKNNMSQSEPLCKDCNVIIVAYDALQAKHVSHLGYHRKTTPMLDQFASQGVAFSNTFSVAPWTIPSYMSIFTGMYPSEHKLVNKWAKYSRTEQVIAHLKDFSPNVKTLAQVLKEQGYATGAFTGDSGVSSNYGYDQGFDIYLDDIIFGPVDGYRNEALSWLNENKDNKIFMFLHGYDSHGQFGIPEDYTGEFMDKNYKGPYKGTALEQRDLREKGLKEGRIYLEPADVDFWRSWYDSKILDADKRVADFWSQLKKIPLKNNTIVIVIADHGTEFYEHNRFDHGFTLYDELVHVPLVFNVPGIKQGRIIPEQVRSIDITPTIIDLIGVNPGEQYKSQLKGDSLVPFLKGEKAESRDVFLETDFRRYTYKRGIRTTDGWKYIVTLENGNEELYNLKNDPNEKNNVIKENAEKGLELKNKVFEQMRKTGTRPEGPWIIECFPVYGDQCPL